MTGFAILHDSDYPLSILQSLGPECWDSPQAVRADEGGAEAVGGAGRQCKVHIKHLRRLFTIKNEFGAAGPPEMYDRSVSRTRSSILRALWQLLVEIVRAIWILMRIYPPTGRGWLRARGCCIT
jgi:hypothetical protein